jgi:hypothetical protein
MSRPRRRQAQMQLCVYTCPGCPPGGVPGFLNRMAPPALHRTQTHPTKARSASCVLIITDDLRSVPWAEATTMEHARAIGGLKGRARLAL